jgi:hypothetical protein
MATLYDGNNVTPTTTAQEIGDAGADWGFQCFTPTLSYTVGSVSLKMYKGATGTYGNVTVSIRAVDGNHRPTGSDLCVGTTPGDTLTTDSTQWTGGEWREITFSTSYDLIAGTEYAIVFRALTCDAGKVIVCFGTTGSVYSGNSGYAVDGPTNPTWNDYAQTDALFRVYGTPAAAAPATEAYVAKKLWGIGSDELWYESPAGTMIQLAASVGQLDTTDFLTAVEAYGKVFIANGTKLKVADFVNVKITVANLTGNPPDFQTVLTGGTSGAKMVVDYITALSGACTIYGKRTTTATFTAETVTGTDNDSNAISFTGTTEVAGPHWYNWTVFGGSATFGVMPTTAFDVKLYRGRLCLAKDEQYPHQWYQSRQRNPWNWLFGENDAQSAVRGGDADAGEIGDIVIAQIPYKDDFMVHACANTLWYLSGDAAEGGSINELDLTSGILGPKAWCWDDKENLFILSTKGLLKIPSGFGVPENLTRDSYPDFVKDLAYNPASHRLVMGYDRKRDGVIIQRTLLADGSNTGYWYSFRSEGLFPETYPEECGMFDLFWYESNDPDYRHLLVGCNDGFIRYYDDTADDDNVGASTEAIQSYVGIGPIKLGDERHEGTIESIVSVLTGDDGTGSTADSDDVTYKIFVDRTADAAIDKLVTNTSPKVSGTLNGPGHPRGDTKKKRVRGMYATIRFENLNASETWGLESISIQGVRKGRLK